MDKLVAPVSSSIRRAIAGCAIALLAGCVKEPAPPEPSARSIAAEMDWAREALERNPLLELIATDTSTGVFTVRHKDSGEVRALAWTELVATPIELLAASAPKESSSHNTAAETPQASEPVATPELARTSDTAAVATPEGAIPPGYKIERADGHIRISGPGVSIVSSGTSAADALPSNSSRRASDPVVCEGRRMLHLDDRDLYVEGDAILARSGCELYITNSRIVASGTGVVVRDATVHISNSTITGAAASFDVGESARLFLRSSSFHGLPHRAEGALVHDQGGNRWQ